IVAGPGTGKTRTLTVRIAHLIRAKGIEPRAVLAITFTNKASREMSERVEGLVPDSRVWISTFHKFCARLLRQYGECVGLQSTFSIIDSADQKQAIRRLLIELDYDPVHYSPDQIRSRISNAKNDLLTPERYGEQFENTVADHIQAVVNRVYPAYQKWLLESNSVDFDDLLMHTAVLLGENEGLRSELGDRYRYVLVDEYQDTNMAQYQIVAAIAARHHNLCVTGDPDQSIYGWRGARIENILRFERDFPNVRTIRLEQNFRSTPEILRSADSLIVNNTRRKHKDLITDKQEGEPVRLLQFENERSEADEVARLIELLKEEEGRRWDNFAIIYRVNSLSRQFETALTRRQIPYQVTAGVAFYERAEVKDLLAYLRVIENPADESAFSRIVNKPLRGLGKTSQDRLLAYSRQHRLTPLDAAATAQDVPKLSKRAIAGFQMFSKMIQEFSLADAGSVAELLKSVIDRTAYASPWTGGQSEESLSKLANVDELVNAARQYDEQAGEERSLQGFLEQTALVSDTDALEEDSGRVSLLTLHAAKGLEFPVVFIVGVEENLIPHQRSLRSEDGREVEEERRLLFVGMTRAQERLYLTCTQVRSMHGKTMPTISSMFLRELEYEFVDLGLPFLSDSSSWNERMDVDEDLNIVFEDADATSSIKTSPKLMTGASLLNGEGGSIELPRGYSIGDQVRHPRYGRGTVIDVGGFGMRRTVTVVFGDDRKETFVASKAPLQPVG
ncbi:MAG: UvrD-helicase domain-containing protein, partial [Planctomycetaceae bacterium]|nr:UvrD-helicase domain-containing protein [Planctomycetaceae bacterium]